MVTKTVEALRVIVQAAVSNGDGSFRTPPWGYASPPQTHISVRRRSGYSPPSSCTSCSRRGRGRFDTRRCCAPPERPVFAGGRSSLCGGLMCDFDERRLDVRRSVWEERGPRANGGHPLEWKTTKGRRARRVAISPTFAALLGEWYEQAVVEGGADAGGYVWPGKDGGPMAADSPTQLVERPSARAGSSTRTACRSSPSTGFAIRRDR